VRVEHLESHRLSELVVRRFEDGRHPSRADAPTKSVRAQASRR
jgi:hypothetical protein